MSDSTRYAAIRQLAARQSAINALADAARCSPLPCIIADGLAETRPVIFANDAFRALAGGAFDKALGLPLMELIGKRSDPSALPPLQTALNEGCSGFWQMGLAFDQGDPFPAAVYLTCVRDPLGHLVAHCINIVDLGSLDLIFRGQGSISPLICDHAPGFIAMSRGQNHTFEYANASYRDFVKRTDLTGKTVAEALPEIIGEGFLTVLDQVYRTGTPFRGSDLPISIRDPATGRLQQHWIDVLYQPMRDASGTITGLFCEGYDVTGLHEMNEVVSDLQIKISHVARLNAMGTMAATLAHELNQPLMAISNYLAGVRTEKGQAPDVARLVTAINGIRETSERALGIINRLRQLTRNRKPGWEHFNLPEAIDECVRLVRSSCSAMIIFDNQAPPDLVMIADRIMIQQVLINLLQNACEAMAGNGPNVITISARQDGDGISVCLADTGPGVSLDAMASMFSWTVTWKDEGMGIGLSICRTIIDLHRGRIWLEKSGPGGSEFRFTVPLNDRSPTAQRADTPPRH